jgi:hypothetical protein
MLPIVSWHPFGESSGVGNGYVSKLPQVDNVEMF